MRDKIILLSACLICSLMFWSCGKASNGSDVKPSVTEPVESIITEENEDVTPVAETPTPTKETEEVNDPEPTWSPDSLKEGLVTVIEYDKKYNAVVESEKDAIETVRLYGDMQKGTYDNPQISEIETKMEEEFGIIYVALGEIDVDTANDIYDGFMYMYDTYPELQGTLTNFSLGNFSWNGMAETRTFEFVSDSNKVPIVLKREIIINAASFLNRKNLLSSCSYNEEIGFWPANASVSMIVVHELGHHMLDVHNASLHGFSGNYVTKDNYDAYLDFVQENLKYNQDEIKRIISAAYTEWLNDNEGTEEDFRGSISDYAKGIQSDGGVSYTETFAEAIADIFANGDNASEASKLILQEFQKD